MTMRILVRAESIGFRGCATLVKWNRKCSERKCSIKAKLSRIITAIAMSHWKISLRKRQKIQLLNISRSPSALVKVTTKIKHSRESSHGSKEKQRSWWGRIICPLKSLGCISIKWFKKAWSNQIMNTIAAQWINQVVVMGCFRREIQSTTLYKDTKTNLRPIWLGSNLVLLRATLLSCHSFPCILRNTARGIRGIGRLVKFWNAKRWRKSSQVVASSTI